MSKRANVSASALKYVGKPIPRSARSGLSDQIKVPNQRNPERQDTEQEITNNYGRIGKRKAQKRGLKCKYELKMTSSLDKLPESLIIFSLLLAGVK